VSQACKNGHHYRGGGDGGVRCSALLSGLPLVFLASLVVAALLPSSAFAVVFEPREFASKQLEVRYKQLNAELRCLVCQNQNVAESDAPLAQDLRREVFRMLNEGRSDTQIMDYMVQRYGDFVLYRPPVKGLTLALWGGPFVLMVLGLLLLWRVMQRRRASSDAQTPLSTDERERLRKLVAGDGSGESV
jgi:cytochrome c-type biogenesis protein CcmH